MFLDVKEIDRYLATAREVSQDLPLIDIHVHPTEILKNKHIYKQVARSPLLYSVKGSHYSTPEISRLRIDSSDVKIANFPLKLRNKLSELVFTNSYNHIGEQVLRDQMTLSGIKYACLLPVPSEVAQQSEQIKFIKTLNKHDSRYIVGYGLENRQNNTGIEQLLSTAKHKHGARIIKIHPNISDINITETKGRAYLEEVLASCGKLSLPIVIHGGISPILGDANNAKYARIDNLAKINWSLSSSTVVLAHFGLYGCNASEISRSEEESIKNIVQKNDNVYVDTSGVGYEIVSKMMSSIPFEKIIFGSDALYMPMWEAMAYLAHASNQSGRSVEQTISQVANKNTLCALPMLLS